MQQFLLQVLLLCDLSSSDGIILSFFFLSPCQISNNLKLMLDAWVGGVDLFIIIIFLI